MDRLCDPDPGLLRRVTEGPGRLRQEPDGRAAPARQIIDFTGNMVLIVAITVEIEGDRPVFSENPVPGRRRRAGDGAAQPRPPAPCAKTAGGPRPTCSKRGSDRDLQIAGPVTDRYVAAAARQRGRERRAEAADP